MRVYVVGSRPFAEKCLGTTIVGSEVSADGVFFLDKRDARIFARESNDYVGFQAFRIYPVDIVFPEGLQKYEFSSRQRSPGVPAPSPEETDSTCY